MKSNIPQVDSRSRQPIVARQRGEAIVSLSQAINVIIEQAGFNDRRARLYLSDLEIRHPGAYTTENTIELLTRECSIGARKLLEGLKRCGLGEQNAYGVRIQGDPFGVEISAETQEGLRAALVQAATDLEAKQVISR